jgi:LmbE family N-acetylglucosaminyl deacetylase
MTILIVAAHPDDEILGCGATIAKRTNQDEDAYLLILGEGVKSREGWTQDEYDSLHGCIEKANDVIGIPVGNITVLDFPDNRFDSVPLLDIVKAVSKVKNRVQPDTVFTHQPHCLNIDHKRTYEATITATRPMEDEPVKTIYAFEILSSSEWSFPQRFSPNVFFDVKETINKKMEALRMYHTELRDYPHPRSLNGVYHSAQLWGMRVGVPFAEAFELVRNTR